METSEIQAVKQRFGIIGVSEALNHAIDVAIQVAPTNLSVLITGESGVGKEKFPQIIHQYSARKHNTYIAVNCGAIPEGTIDSELFGHEKGAFTSATNDRKGYFEVADGGTIFLDEVGELPLSTQARLLRVLENGEFLRVGSSKVQKTNVRVVAATNLDIPKAIAEGRFREDLYFRLNGVPIHIPPLRERKEDTVLLFRKFANDCAEQYKMPAVKLTDEAQDILRNYYWQGNIRQLKNIAEQISVIETERNISAETLRRYLPNNEQSTLPTLFGRTAQGNSDKSFNSEREILYQVLFDMRRDMNDLKKLVNDIMSGTAQTTPATNYAATPAPYTPASVPATTSDTAISAATISDEPDLINIAPTGKQKMMQNRQVEDTEEYIEESLSLEDAEKEMITKALERHNGKRKLAAQDLKISERTLYRKIKEYGIEEN